MRKMHLLLIFVCTFLYSCNNPKNTDANTGQSSITETNANKQKLNAVLEKYATPSQNFQVSANKPSVVTGYKGTRININPNDLVTESGKPLNGNINVELKELTNQADLLSENAQTVSDGKLLVSGGAYFIGMTSDGEPLKLKEGENLRIQFPKMTDKKMTLFYGQTNEAGEMNWQTANEDFKTTTQPKPQKAVDTIPIWVSKQRALDEAEMPIDYISEDADNPNLTPAERARIVKERKLEDKLYDEIGINQLGWINCDRFLEVANKTELITTFNPKDSIKNGNVLLVFKDINSVMQGYYDDTEPLQFGDIPVGYKAKLIAYTIKNEKIFAVSTDLTIAKGQIIMFDLKEISDNNFKKLIGK